MSPEEIEANQAAQRDMFAALKARKEALEDALKKKTELLKELCAFHQIFNILSF